jgi:CelD/BcsL family acetyltransferase involved in cellulose biosynthesis
MQRMATASNGKNDMDDHSPLPGSLPGGTQQDAQFVSSPSQPTPPYFVQEITTESGLADLEEDWNRLSKSCASPNVFMTFDWFRVWNQCFGQKSRGGWRPKVLVLKKDGAVVGISPLTIRKASSCGVIVRKLEFVETLADYHDIVLGDDLGGQSRALAEYLVNTKDQWDLVDLRDLSLTRNPLEVIGGALSEVGLHYRVLPEKERCPYLPIAGNSAKALEKVSGHIRRTMRKRMERAHALGLRVRIIENPQDEPGLLEKMIALEAQKHSGGKLSEPFLGKFREEFQSLFDSLGPRQWLYVALMELEGKPVAFQLGFRPGKKLWDYSKAHDHTFSQYAPGTLLVAALVDYGYSQGYDEYDFLRGEETYKTVWSTGFHERFQLLIWSNRLTSRARSFIYLDLKRAVYRLMGKGE